MGEHELEQGGQDSALSPGVTGLAAARVSLSGRIALDVYECGHDKSTAGALGKGGLLSAERC